MCVQRAPVFWAEGNFFRANVRSHPSLANKEVKGHEENERQFI